ncbi:MAG: GNAT family N-acetyltransferase [Bacillota bacterium]
MSFALRPMVEADHPRIVAIINAQVPDPTTLEEFRRGIELRPKTDPVLRLVAVTGEGVIAGYGIASGGELNEPGSFTISVRVEAAYQRQGLGTRLLQALEPWCAEQGAQHLDGGVQERHPQAIAWAEGKGYRKRHHLFQSRLTLDGFDATPFLGPLERARAEGFRIISLAELPAADETYQELYAFYLETGRDVPGQEQMPEIPYDLFEKAMIQHPRFEPAAIFVALDGDRWAAIAHMFRRQDGSYYHQYTGVRREYRGRGLSTAVKAAALQWAMATGVPALVTHNHSANQRMLAVNRKMGYQPEPGLFMLRKSLAG